MRLHHSFAVEFPDEVTQAVLSGLHIDSVVAEDLLFFSNLTRLDMSDNEVRSRTHPPTRPTLSSVEYARTDSLWIGLLWWPMVGTT